MRGDVIMTAPRISYKFTKIHEDEFCIILCFLEVYFLS